MVIAGAVLLHLGYFSCVTLAALDSIGGGDAYLPLLIPVVGPFVAIGTFRSVVGPEKDKAIYTAVGAALGTAQAGSAALLIVGLAAGKRVLVREQTESPRIAIHPVVGRDTWGLGIGGSF
jgi:hypothetical protein